MYLGKYGNVILLCVGGVCELNGVIVFDYDIIWVVEWGVKLVVSYKIYI